MEADLALVIGLLLAGFSLVGIFSAISDGRGPRASALTILIAGGFVVYALQTQPGGYTLEDIPNAFVRVIGQFL